MKTPPVILAVVWLLVAPCVSSAAVIFEFFAEDVSIEAGGEVSVPIYLQETLTDGSQSLITAEGGLFSAGFHLEFSAGISEMLSLVGNVSVFDDTVAESVTASVSSYWAEQDEVEAPAFPNGVGRILFGTVTIKAPSLPGASGAFTISRYQTGLDAIVTYDGVAIDSLVNSSTFTVTAIPEPSGLIWVGVIGLVVVRLRKRADAVEG